MHRLLSRTSITVDEAVSILLGHTTGPVEFEPLMGTKKPKPTAPYSAWRDSGR